MVPAALLAALCLLPQQPAVTVELINPAPAARRGVVLASVPLPRGALPTGDLQAGSVLEATVEHDGQLADAPALPLVRWRDGSIAVLQVHLLADLPANGRTRVTVRPQRSPSGLAATAPARPHRPLVSPPLPLWTELTDPWDRRYRAELVADEAAGPGGVAWDSGAARLVRFRAAHVAADGRALLDLRAYLLTFDGERRAELTLVLDNQEPACGPLGAVRFASFRLCTADDRLRFLPAFAAENQLLPAVRGPAGGYEQWLLGPDGQHYLGDGTAKAFRLHLFVDGEGVDDRVRAAALWAPWRCVALPDLDGARATGAFSAFGGPAPCPASDPGLAGEQLAWWRLRARFGPYGGWGDPENDGLPGAPRSGDSLLHNVLRWRRPELLATAEGMVLQHTLRPTAGRCERRPADTQAFREGLLPLAQAAPHGFTAPAYEHASALLLYDYWWLTGDPLARDELLRLGQGVLELLRAAPFRTSRGEGQCLLAGVLAARAGGDARLLAALAEHAQQVLLPALFPGAGALPLPQPAHESVLDGQSSFDAPWQMAALVRGLAALHADTGTPAFAAAAVRIADAMAGPGWVEHEGPKTFVSAADAGRYTVAALPDDRAGSDRTTIGAFVLAAELADDPAIAQRLRACADFLLDRELPVDAGPERRWISANPWLQVALDRHQRVQ